MEEQTRDHLFTFWDLTDELLNLVLFGLIGVEVIALSVSMQTLLPGFLCIPIVLLARFVSVGAPIALIRRFRPFTPHRSEEHTSELQSLMRNSYAVFCWKKK